MKLKTAARSSAAAALVLLALALTACQRSEPAASAAAAAPRVGVVVVQAQPVSLTTELPGRTAAYRIAEVRPQVNGIVLKRLFTEGGEVKAGQQLYQIDPALYQATLDSERAALARSEALVKSATLLAQRYQPLTETRAISRQTYDDAVAARDQARADVLAAKAAVDRARINLVYTRVLAPISGIVGRSTVTEGALVTANQSAPLATVQQIDPIYVDVVQSSAQLLRLQNQLAQGHIARADGPQAARVSLTLEDGSTFDHDGKLQFSEVTVDPSTGSVTLRAVFPNPDRRLLPGMFVRARLNEGVAQQGLLVPQRGVVRNQRGLPTVNVVNAENKIEVREISADRVVGDSWLVTGGLQPGEKVVVEGLQTIRPGMAVSPVEVAPKAGDAGQAPAPAAAAGNTASPAR